MQKVPAHIQNVHELYENELYEEIIVWVNVIRVFMKKARKRVKISTD